MIKNRTAQLIYQTVYLTLGLVGLIASLGIFDNINTIQQFPLHRCYAGRTYSDGKEKRR